MGGRQFIRTVMAETLENHIELRAPLIVVMNLPALALDFIAEFRGLLGDADTRIDVVPRVYCYCFSFKGKPQLVVFIQPGHI